MKVLEVPNVHVALPRALKLLDQHGMERGSRNGPVKIAPFPVTTVYERPWERVIFWSQRDANPFFHLYESLWMLAGRDDVAPLAKYAKNMLNYSDDGETLHGAYGARWRKWPVDAPITWIDQLPTIIERLKTNPDDRRCVLEMWDCTRDLGENGKDVPCNVIATFQRDHEGRLDLTVFCRSNDIIWGAYGANAVHFSFLLEYMALAIGCPMGKLYQVSVNWHGYLSTLEPLKDLRPDKYNFVVDPYANGRVKPTQLSGSLEYVDKIVQQILFAADSDTAANSISGWQEPWVTVALRVLGAHELYRQSNDEKRFGRALEFLNDGDLKADWIVAAREWVLKREMAWVQNHVV